MVYPPAAVSIAGYERLYILITVYNIDSWRNQNNGSLKISWEYDTFFLYYGMLNKAHKLSKAITVSRLYKILQFKINLIDMYPDYYVPRKNQEHCWKKYRKTQYKPV